MKDILQGCSPNSPEAIELNLTRAVKSAGLKSGDIASALLAQKAMSALNLDPRAMSQILNMEKVIAENGVPAVEIARVLSDGVLPKELSDQLAEQVIPWKTIGKTNCKKGQQRLPIKLQKCCEREVKLYLCHTVQCF